MDAQPFCDIALEASRQDLVKLVRSYLPDGDFRRILIKPNWVRHEREPDFPIAAMVTSSRLVDAVIEACLSAYPRAQRILVGDAPLQDCNWDLLCRQAGIDRLMGKYRDGSGARVQIADLRRERFQDDGGFLRPLEPANAGDPAGYREIALDGESLLDAFGDSDRLFRVTNYSSRQTMSSHRSGFHRYLIAGSALECDLFINLPKMKTHQKAGITGALKNVVGINGEKAYLAHYRRGDPSRGGDEFSRDTSRAVVMQCRVREMLQKRSKFLFRLGSLGWQVARTLRGIEVKGTAENLSKRFYMAGGSWFGNDTIWRMVYDLNKILLYTSPDGAALRDTAQRAYLAILDGMMAGEGDGPLQPLAVPTDLVACSNDPFLLDMVMASLMGFDYRKIPVLKNMPLFSGSPWGRFDPEEIEVRMDGRPLRGISSLPTLHQFRPAPGWAGHIEREA